jgi:plasmid maintenance system antidote protein VapI
MVIENVCPANEIALMAKRPDELLPAPLSKEMRPERIGHRLMLLRIALDMKPAEISDMLGIERTYWSRFEGGKRPITDQVAALLVDRFGVTLDFLILGRWDRLPLDLAQRMRALEAKNSSSSETPSK